MFLFLRFVIYNELTSYMKIKNSIYTLLVVCLSLTSCISNDSVENTYNENLSLLTFAIKDIKTTIGEGDDAKTFTVKGSDYDFSISQYGTRLIFNTDSLPYQTNLEKVVTNVTASGNITYSETLGDNAGTEKVWNSTDSINFTGPVYFTIHHADGVNKKKYKVNIFAHNVNPDTLMWKRYETTNFPINVFQKIKAVSYNQRIYIFGNTSETQLKVTSSSNATTWETPVTLDGLEAKAELNSILSFDGKLYTTANNLVYSSTDAIHWAKVNNASNCEKLIGTNSTQIIGINNNHFVYATLDASNQTINWQESNETLPTHFATDYYSSSHQKLASNNNLEQTVLLGSNSQIWSKLIREESWTHYTSETKTACPILENIQFINYADYLYAIGGKGTFNGEEIEAFSSFFESKDKGHTWHKKTTNMTLPDDFKTISGEYTCIVDGEKYIWFIQNDSKIIWKGKINRLSFQQQD